MTTYPGSPRVLRGALVSVDPVTLRPSVIPFQYNPATLTSSFQVSAATAGAEAGQRGGPPSETVQVEIELDATDDLEAGRGPDTVAARIAAILGLVSPLAADVEKNLGLVAQGAIEILPPDAPILLFVFGPRRVLPVQLTELSVTEEAHDAELNPIRARVSLGLSVLRYADLSQSHPAHALSLANQVAREASARSLSSENFEAAIGTRIVL